MANLTNCKRVRFACEGWIGELENLGIPAEHQLQARNRVLAGGTENAVRGSAVVSHGEQVDLNQIAHADTCEPGPKPELEIHRPARRSANALSSDASVHRGALIAVVAACAGSAGRSKHASATCITGADVARRSLRLAVSLATGAVATQTLVVARACVAVVAGRTIGYVRENTAAVRARIHGALAAIVAISR